MPSFLPRSIGARVFFVGLLIVIAVAIGLFWGDYFYTQERFPYNTYIENVDVSLLSIGEARGKLERTPINQAVKVSPSLYYNETGVTGEFRFVPSEIGLYIKTYETVRSAFESTHRHSFIRSLAQRISKERNEVPLILGVDDKVLRPILLTLTLEVNAASQEAKVILKEKGAYDLIPDIPGRKLEISESINKIGLSLLAGERRLPLSVKVLLPRVQMKDLVAHPPVHQISRFETFYGSHDSPNRISNIKTIAGWIDKTILLSGETFSLLNVIGDFTPERGFKEAFVIVGDELVPEYGGGTCQIATTLFNTVLLADLEIVQRRNHSIWFNIYPLGRDATVYPGITDFKFRNDTGRPIMLAAKATKHSLTFMVYGTTTSKEVSFSSPIVTYFSSTEGKKITTWRLPGPNHPYNTVVTVTTKQGGKVIREQEFHSYYHEEGDKGVIKIKRPEPR